MESRDATESQGAAGIVVRRAKPTDLAGLLDLYRYLQSTDYRPAPERIDATWKALLATPGLTVFVVEASNTLVASCTLIVTPNLTRGARPFAVIENVVTHADFRRRGFGKAVLHAALSAAWEADCYRVTLTTGRKDQGTFDFYEAAGFERGSKTAFQIRRDRP